MKATTREWLLMIGGAVVGFAVASAVAPLWYLHSGPQTTFAPAEFPERFEPMPEGPPVGVEAPAKKPPRSE